jgi:sugar/nucleoside kinase (ribokinase family)
MELLAHVDIAIISQRFCEQLKVTTAQALDLLRAKGCKVGGVTQGEHGLLWYGEDGATRHLDALHVPEDRVIDTNGAGDLFHGAYVYSWLREPSAKWERHFRFARAASAYGVQYLGNEARLPRQDDVFATAQSFGDPLR